MTAETKEKNDWPSWEKICEMVDNRPSMQDIEEARGYKVENELYLIDDVAKICGWSPREFRALLKEKKIIRKNRRDEWECYSKYSRYFRNHIHAVQSGEYRVIKTTLKMSVYGYLWAVRNHSVNNANVIDSAVKGMMEDLGI